MLEIRNLHASVGKEKILQGLDLTIGPGEVHAIMGPNGSGKSTLSQIIAGRDGYDITAGSVLFEGQDLLEMDPEERARAGVFLSFQYPVEIPGVSTAYFLRAALNAQRTARGEEEMDAVSFLRLAKGEISRVGLDTAMLKRSLNEGFSGGEKKRNETFQLSVLKPKLAILDEVDSGLDVDAMKAVAERINAQRSPERSFIVITHYERLLTYVVPDHIHILVNGRIVASGDETLAVKVEQDGYGWTDAAASA